MTNGPGVGLKSVEIHTVFVNPPVVRIYILDSNDLQTALTMNQETADKFLANLKLAVDAMRVSVATEPMFKKCATCGRYHDKLENGICHRCSSLAKDHQY